MPRKKNDADMPFTISDKANSDLYVHHHAGVLRYVPEAVKDGFLFYNDEYWQVSIHKEEELLAEKTMDLLRQEAMNYSDKKMQEAILKRVGALESRSRMKAMIEQSKAKLASSYNEFERHPLWLNCGNGLLDLETGKLSAHSPEDRCLFFTPVEYRTKANQYAWIEFLESIHPGQPEVTGFLKRAIGYTITGNTNEEVFFYLHGAERTGKGTFLKCVFNALGGTSNGSYGVKTPKRAWLQSWTENQKNALIGYQKQRLIWIDEIGATDRVDCAKLKDWVGGDPVSDRYLWESCNKNFFPRGKLWFQGNHYAVMDPDNSVFRKMMPIEFNAQLEVDKNLKNDLSENHLEAVLAWAVEGYYEYLEKGLAPPPEVLAAREKYQNHSDVLGQFIAEHCVEGSNFNCLSEGFLKELNSFAAYSGSRDFWTRETLRDAMAKKGFIKSKKNIGSVFMGLKLLSQYSAVS